MVAITKELKVGPGEDFTSFTSAVIDAKVRYPMMEVHPHHFTGSPIHMHSRLRTSRLIWTLLTQATKQLCWSVAKQTAGMHFFCNRWVDGHPLYHVTVT